MMEHLKTKAEQLGISRNTFLMRLLQEDMERESTHKDLRLDSDAVVEKIVSGVAERLSDVIAAVQAAGMEAAARSGARDMNPEIMGTAGGETGEVLSDDAMDFLSGF